MNNDISARIEGVFKTTLEVESVPADLSQKNCEAWDSVNHLNLILALEAEFGITFEPEEIAEMQDFSAAEKQIRSKI